MPATLTILAGRAVLPCFQMKTAAGPALTAREALRSCRAFRAAPDIRLGQAAYKR